MRRNLCPKLEVCETPVKREEFLSTCVGNHEKCPLNSMKQPRQWLEEFKGGLKIATPHAARK